MKTNRVTIISLIIFISLSVFLTTCLKEEATNLPIEETEWVLETLNGQPLIEGSNITLRFSSETLSGFGGCNQYGGHYTIVEPNRFSMAETEVTMQLCQEPVGVVEQENEYLKAIGGASEYEIADDFLLIENPVENISLMFQKKEEVQVNPAKLVGPEWTLVSWNNNRYSEEQKITIVFSGNEIKGDAGCREYAGTYEAEGDDITILTLQMIGEFEGCSDELMSREGEYTTSLEWVRNYRLDGNRLELLTERAETLVFTSSVNEH